MDIDDFLTIKEYAHLIKVHPCTVRRAIKSGHITCFQVGSGKKSPIRIPKSEIDRIAIVKWEKVVKSMVKECLEIDEKDSVC